MSVPHSPPTLRDPPRNGRVTVIIPTCNRARLLPGAIQSALDQTARERCDIVVLDDGSTDETPRVAAAFGARVQYIRQANAGLGAARNAAICAWPNEFVAFLDDDDAWSPEKVEVQLAALERAPAAVFVSGRTWERHPDGSCRLRPLPVIPLDRPADLAPPLFVENFLPPSTMLVRSSALCRTELFRHDLCGAEDHHLWIRLACRGPGIVLARAVADYRVGTPGALSGEVLRMLRMQLRLRHLVAGELARRPDCRAHWRRGVAVSLRTLRDAAYRAGRYALAARYGLEGLARHPFAHAAWEWRRSGAALYRAIGAGPGGPARALANAAAAAPSVRARAAACAGWPG